MNSNFGNQEQSHNTAEAHDRDIEIQPRETADQADQLNADQVNKVDQVNTDQADQKGQPELEVNDRRRFTSDGEIIEREQDQQKDSRKDPDQEQVEALSELEQIKARLKEAEDKRIEAERQSRDFSERFRHAQAKIQAEADEQRVRMQRNFEQRLEAARCDVVAGLLDSLDNLKRAISAAEKSDNKNSDFVALLEGVRATALMFESKMQGLGLSPLSTTGEEFNPEIHEAVEIVPVGKDQDNRVIEEFQTGYKFGPRLLRPARVRVGRASE